MTEKTKRERVQDEIILVLEELGGEVREGSGLAVRKIFERMATTKSYTEVSSLMSDLEAEGKIIRDMPSLKRTTRVALAGRGFAPPVKDIKVVLEQFSRTLAEDLEGTVNHLVDAHVAAKLEEQRSKMTAEANGELQAENDKLRKTVEKLRERVKENEAEPMRLRGELDQAEAEIESLRERLRVAEHNVEVWKQNAIGRPAFREAMAAFKDKLRDDDRRALERMMRELPK